MRRAKSNSREDFKEIGIAVSRVPLFYCNGPTLEAALAAATLWLERNVSVINSLNVFPVPDGDTGTNMLLTMRAAMLEAALGKERRTDSLLKAVAQGALMGARGNSGVILSQFLKGLHKGVEGLDIFSAKDLAVALEEGYETAYAGVIKPVEGTILTVMRDVSEAAQAHVQGDQDLVRLMGGVVQAARESVVRTPELLPALKTAGVVDAGGHGLYILLEGISFHLRGQEIPPAPLLGEEILGRAKVDAGLTYGYCTEFLLSDLSIDLDKVRTVVASLGDSASVVGDSQKARVHVHTLDPEGLIGKASQWGAVTHTKIDNIQKQYTEFLTEHGQLPQAEGSTSGIAIVAAVPSVSLAKLFAGLGATRTVVGGPGHNPSVHELVEALESIQSPKVIILANHPNIVPAAQQAAAMTEKEAAIVASENIAQGVSALLAFNYQADLATNQRAMEVAARGAMTAEITRAVRDAVVQGISIKKGQLMAIVQGELAAVGDALAEVAGQALERMGLEGKEIVTIYWGEGGTPEDAQELAGVISRRWSAIAIEVVEGGQPFYSYILSAD